MVVNGGTNGDGEAMSMVVTAVPNAYENNAGKPFDLNDPHQQPNLSFFDFNPKPRSVWFDTLCKMYRTLENFEHTFRDNQAIVPYFKNMKEFTSARDPFINAWLDRFIARGEGIRRFYLSGERTDFVDPKDLQFLDLLPNGFLRRGLLPTRVHYAEPRKSGESGDAIDVAVSQLDWVKDPSIAEGVRERQRLARRAELTVGELEELQRKANASS